MALRAIVNTFGTLACLAAGELVEASAADKSSEEAARAASDATRFYRPLLLVAGVVYLIWWALVHVLLPTAFNPLGSRVAVVAICLSCYAASFAFEGVRRRLPWVFAFCGSLITLHYFYLFHRNTADINWVVGSYITVIAVSACLPTTRALWIYAAGVFALSVAQVAAAPTLLQTVFLPGMATILAFVYVGLANRVRYERAQEALRVREEFISIASHELKTPLTSIKLHAQIATRSLKRGDGVALSPERMQRFIALTDRNADRLTVLVEEMLEFSRISHGMLPIQKSSFDLAELVRDCLAQFPTAEAVELALPEQPLRVNADRRRLEQVITNLLSNAWKYGEGKPIRLEVHSEGGLAQLSVLDHGMGVGPEDHARIFQKFERAVPSAEVSGLGLGLYISREIVEAHGGSISVQSRRGEGARFTVELPLDASSLS